MPSVHFLALLKSEISTKITVILDLFITKGWDIPITKIHLIIKGTFY